MQKENNLISYTWFARKDVKFDDKLGISSNDTSYLNKYIIYDNMQYAISYSKKFEKYEDGKIIKYLVYKIDGCTDFILHESNMNLYFVYIGDTYKDIKFNHIIFRTNKYF